MKFLTTLLLLIMASSALAEKKYVDLNERAKRGLLENDVVTAPPVVDTKVETTKERAAAIELTPQQLLCECGKLKNMNEKLERIYWSSNELERAMVKIKEIDARETNVQATMVYLVSAHKNDKTPADPEECTDSKIGENSIKKLKGMIAAQEKKCDVYELRGISND